MLDGKKTIENRFGCDVNVGCPRFVCFNFVLSDSFCSQFGEEIELQLAMGNLDIDTLERIDDFNPDESITKVQNPPKYQQLVLKTN